jgi:hypothetical protein
MNPRPIPMQEAIRRRAEEIYIRNGKIPGRDVQNWMQAEQEILAESLQPHKNAVVIKVNGARYVGEYDRQSADGYVPGELAPGAPVPVRFEGDKMFVQRHNGKELETTIINKTI